MKTDRNSNRISENVDRVVNALNGAGIEIRNISPVNPYSVRVEFMYDEIFFAIYVMEYFVEFITYLGTTPSDDARLPAFKEATNRTNFGMMCDRILWDGPDTEKYIWFLLKRVSIIEKVDTVWLKSSLNFAFKMRDIWMNNCQSFLEPGISDLDSRMN